MSSSEESLSRRKFVLLAAVLGVQPAWLAACAHGSGVDDLRSASSGLWESATSDQDGDRAVPKRAFGSTGERVSILALGGIIDSLRHPEILDLAYERGIRYWETTLIRGGRGYGAYFARHPEHRQHVFLLAKTKGPDASAAEADLVRTLVEIGSSYVDFFIIQGIDDPAILSAELRSWADRAKRQGRIRYFGFSSHANMQRCLASASTLDWIDGVVTTYNYRLMQEPAMEGAIRACADRGIAITAIKSQALPMNPRATIGDESVEAKRFLAEFEEEGASPFQVRLRAVWSNPNIASICSMMTDRDSILSNVAASRQGTIGPAAAAWLAREARTTASDYCSGCAKLCQSGPNEDVPIAKVMRYLMYLRGYGDRRRARDAFARLSEATRASFARRDYAVSEASCPRDIPIAERMREALAELS